MISEYGQCPAPSVSHHVTVPVSFNQPNLQEEKTALNFSGSTANATGGQDKSDGRKRFFGSPTPMGFSTLNNQTDSQGSGSGTSSQGHFFSPQSAQQSMTSNSVNNTGLTTPLLLFSSQSDSKFDSKVADNGNQTVSDMTVLQAGGHEGSVEAWLYSPNEGGIWKSVVLTASYQWSLLFSREFAFVPSLNGLCLIRGPKGVSLQVYLAQLRSSGGPLALMLSDSPVVLAGESFPVGLMGLDEFSHGMHGSGRLFISDGQPAASANDLGALVAQVGVPASLTGHGLDAGVAYNQTDHQNTSSSNMGLPGYFDDGHCLARNISHDVAILVSDTTSSDNQTDSPEGSQKSSNEVPFFQFKSKSRSFSSPIFSWSNTSAIPNPIQSSNATRGGESSSGASTRGNVSSPLGSQPNETSKSGNQTSSTTPPSLFSSQSHLGSDPKVADNGNQRVSDIVVSPAGGVKAFWSLGDGKWQPVNLDQTTILGLLSFQGFQGEEGALTVHGQAQAAYSWSVIPSKDGRPLWLLGRGPQGQQLLLYFSQLSVSRDLLNVLSNLPFISVEKGLSIGLMGLDGFSHGTNWSGGVLDDQGALVIWKPASANDLGTDLVSHHVDVPASFSFNQSGSQGSGNDNQTCPVSTNDQCPVDGVSHHVTVPVSNATRGVEHIESAESAPMGFSTPNNQMNSQGSGSGASTQGNFFSPLSSQHNGTSNSVNNTGSTTPLPLVSSQSDSIGLMKLDWLSHEMDGSGRSLDNQRALVIWKPASANDLFLTENSVGNSSYSSSQISSQTHSPVPTSTMNEEAKALYGAHESSTWTTGMTVLSSFVLGGGGAYAYNRWNQQMAQLTQDILEDSSPPANSPGNSNQGPSDNNRGGQNSDGGSDSGPSGGGGRGPTLLPAEQIGGYGGSTVAPITYTATHAVLDDQVRRHESTTQAHETPVTPQRGATTVTEEETSPNDGSVGYSPQEMTPPEEVERVTNGTEEGGGVARQLFVDGHQGGDFDFDEYQGVATRLDNLRGHDPRQYRQDRNLVWQRLVDIGFVRYSPLSRPKKHKIKR